MTEANSINASTAGLVINTGTGFTATTVTQHDVLVGGASNAITSISPSTSGFVLTSNGVSADPTFQTAPVGSKWVYLDKKTAASAPTIVFSSGISSTYNSYIFVLEGVVVDGSSLLLQWSSNGGSTYDTANYSGGIIYSDPATGAGVFASASTSEGIQVCLTSVNTDPGASVELWLMNRNGFNFIKGNGSSQTGAGMNCTLIAGSNTSLNTGINTVRFTSPSQANNITAGSITLYGLIES